MATFVVSTNYAGDAFGVALAASGIATRLGAVYNYTYRGVTRYRFVPTTYSASQDAFYSTFDSGTDTLINFIVSRGV